MIVLTFKPIKTLFYISTTHFPTKERKINMAKHKQQIYTYKLKLPLFERFYKLKQLTINEMHLP